GRFGDLTTARKRLRAAARHRATALERRDRITAIASDVRFAVRRARKAPAFTTLALATLALGIGITTATFTIIEGVLLRPLPFAPADRVGALSAVVSVCGDVVTVAAGNWQDWRRESRTAEGIALYMYRRMSVVDEAQADRVSAQLVSGNFFDVLQPRFL